MQNKIKILFLASDPKNEPRLRLGQECREIEDQLIKSKQRDLIDLIPKFSVRADDMVHAILNNSPNIIHFSGHGSDSGHLCLENETGNVQMITPSALSSLFELVSKGVSCVVLNACFSEIQAKEISKHIDFVIGMKNEIGDIAAIQFAVGFYRAIGAGKPIDEAFNFGIVQLKLLNIAEELTPTLIKKSKTVPISQDRMNPIFSAELKQIKSDVYQFLVNDQIKETGAWGISQIEIMEEASGSKLSEHDKKEGGIVSTYLALRALLKYEPSPVEFRLKNYSKLAQVYFLQRQNNTGGFGRYVFSRSGFEIHASLRHTALSVSALIDLGGPPGATYRGINYINKHWNIEEILDDASPALAIASIIHTIDKLISNPYYLSQFTEEEKSNLKLSEWNDVCKKLHRELKNLSSISNFKPFWKPYGGNKPLLFETALTTIDLLSYPLNNDLNSVIVDILYSMLERMNPDGGIPYNLDETKSDFGMSLYFYSLISRNTILSCIENKAILGMFINSRQKLENYINNNRTHFTKHRFTHCDTIAPVLFVD